MSTRRSDPSARLARPDARDVRRRRLRDRGQPASTFPTAAREASLPDLVVLSERYGLSPAETAEVLVAACAPPTVVTHVVHGRCDGDVAATIEACRSVLDPDATERALRHEPIVVRADRLAIAADPAGVDGDEYAQLRDALGEPAAPTALAIASDEGLLAALDAAGARRDGLGLERDGRE